MNIIIHQPYFLPWLGYFSKFEYAQKITFLDDVKFSKGFYIDRTKYICHSGETKWLSLPIGNNSNKKINEIKITNKSFVKNHLSTLYGSYSKADFFSKEWKDLEQIIYSSFSKYSYLHEININIIIQICLLLKMEIPTITLSSESKISKNKTQKIIDLCNRENCDGIVMGDGSSLKVHDWKEITKNNINVYIQNFYGKHPTYKQIRRQKMKFSKGVSIIDAILNIGRTETLNLLKSNDTKPFILKQ